MKFRPSSICGVFITRQHSKYRDIDIGILSVRRVSDCIETA